MNKKVIVTLASVFMVSPCLVQADYSVQLDVFVTDRSEEFEYDGDFGSFDSDTDTLSKGIDIVGYIGRVDTGSAPYAEAGFLSKLSSISAGYSRCGKEEDCAASALYADESAHLDESALRFSGRAVIPNSDVILFAELQKGEIGSVDRDIKTFGGGFYYSDTGALTFSYSQDDIERYNDKYKSLRAEWRQVNMLPNTQYLSFFVTWELERGNEEIEDWEADYAEGGVTYYVNQKFGFGATARTMVATSDYADSIVEVSFRPHIRFDFVENFGVYAEIDSTVGFVSYEDSDDEADYSSLGFTAGLTTRF